MQRLKLQNFMGFPVDRFQYSTVCGPSGKSEKERQAERKSEYNVVLFCNMVHSD